MPLDFLRETEQYQKLLSAVQEGTKSISLTGVIDAAKPYVLALLVRDVQRPVIFIRPSTAALFRFREQCRFFLEELHPVKERTGTTPLLTAAIFPALSENPYQEITPSLETISSRMRFLHSLLHETPALIITSLKALLKPFPNPENLSRSFVELAMNEKYGRDRLLDKLAEFGYSREDLTNSHGEYAWRGGIVDVFSPWADHPFRIEFSGDDVVSLRKFDSFSQRSLHKIDRILIPALYEFPNSRTFFEEWENRALQKASRIYLRDIEKKTDSLRSGDIFPSFAYASLLNKEYFVPFHHYLKEALFLVDDMNEVESDWEDSLGEFNDQFDELKNMKKFALSPDAIYPPVLWENIKYNAVKMNSFFPQPGRRTLFVHLNFQSVPQFNNKIPFFLEYVKKHQEERNLCAVYVSNEVVRRKLAALLSQEEIPHCEMAGPFDVPRDGALALLLGRLAKGFSYPENRVTYFSEQDIFTAEKVLIRRKQVKPFSSHFQDLQAGDYIVHSGYGIGIFSGLIKMAIEGNTQEFMQLLYKDDDKLFVPVEDLNLVQKYAGVGTAAPVLNKLGTLQWERTKSRTKKAVEELAKELLQLYAKRKALKGHSFAVAGNWHEDFEKSFEFDETGDQNNAIKEITEDMESASPMDRLLVGDVGYGKTEVAMRAAFKAVMDGHQVAVLCPTTVLVSQHLKTFRRRIALFPLRIESLTRMQTGAGRKKVIEDIKTGLVDIVIGTHRILSKDVEFKRLGLLIVDEEQRFGVKHKEKLKKIKASIDVLTLTATPIPRTLNMSLTGLRDISLIETPPKDRLAIHTVVTLFSQDLIIRAIKSELGRGGQVYFIHNSIDDIQSISEKISQWVPEADVVYIHGRMSGAVLEKRMIDFIHGEYNVLVSTTIIENGIDIPLVNTLIVNRADRFGLAQLYQLRGRVGRSSRQAVAYFLVPSFAELMPLARQRLKALKEFSELGAGFRLAARDLEIRGAGNFFGSRQHGYIEAVGFDYYMQLLDNSVRELKGEDIEEFKTELNLKVNIRIPEEYLPQINLRLNLYKRVSSAETVDEIERIREEIKDRFGPLPAGMRNLLRYGIVRFLAQRLKIKGIDRIGSKIIFDYFPRSSVDTSRIPRLLNRHRGTMTPQGVMSFNLLSEREENILDETILILNELSDM